MNNREIKFRAWDKENKVMLDEFPSKDDYGSVNDIFKAQDNLIPLQFTGLKDKNGKDVYEGDIVKCSSGCPHLMEWRVEVPSSGLGGMPGFYLSGLNGGYVWMKIEKVIGNIYENPELLTNK